MCIISGEPHKISGYYSEGPPNTLVKKSMMNRILVGLGFGFCVFLLATCMLGLAMECIDVWIAAHDSLMGWMQ